MKSYPKYLPYLILLAGFIVSISSAYFSVYGLSQLFSGVFLQSLILFGTLEFSKLIIATVLYRYWSVLGILIKSYLTTALLILVIITSIGVYGFLSGGYKATANKFDIYNKEINLLDLKKDRYSTQLNEYNTEKSKLIEDINSLRTSLSNKVATQYVDKRSGSVITSINNQSRKSFETQLSDALKRRDLLDQKIESLSDTITKIEVSKIEAEATSEVSAEVGPLKFIAEALGTTMDTIVKYLLLLLVIVIDPLAVILLITANHTMLLNQKKEEISEAPRDEPMDQNEPISSEVPTNNMGVGGDPVLDEVSVVKEVPSVEVIQQVPQGTITDVDVPPSVTEKLSNIIGKVKRKLNKKSEIPDLSPTQKKNMTGQEIKEFYETWKNTDQ